MSTKIIKKILLIVLFLMVLATSCIVVQSCCFKSTLVYEKEQLIIKSSPVSMYLKALDLERRQAHIEIFTSMVFNFNSTLESIPLKIYGWDGSYVGDAYLTKREGNPNYSFFQMNETAKDFTVFFRGGPEVYPFDRYEFNMTLAFWVGWENARLPESTRNYTHVLMEWPLRVLWDGPLDVNIELGTYQSDPSVTITFAIQRPMWQSYACLLPISLIFFLAGFSAFLETDYRNLVMRITIYLSALVLTVGYYALIQGTLPPGRYYLSIPEALIYGLLASSTFFLVFSFISYRTGVNHLITDIIAIVCSIAFVSFIIITLYVNPIVRPLFYSSFVSCLVMEWMLSTMLFAGLLFYAGHRMYKYTKEVLAKHGLMVFFKIPVSTIDNTIRGMYWIAGVLNSACLFITAYLVWRFGPAIELNPLRRIVFELAGQNLGVMIGTQLPLSILIFLLGYYLPRFKRMYFLSDFLGIELLMISIPDYLNDFILLPLPIPQLLILWIILIAFGVCFSLFFREVRKSTIE